MNSAPRRLKSSSGPLVSSYDCAMLDLDGVVYVGERAVPGVSTLLAEARSGGMTLAYVTNNAARTPATVARQLCEMGVDAHADDVVTSAQAAARLVVERVPAGAPVLVVGGEGLVVALEQHDLSPVSSAEDGPAAVVQGFHPTVGWKLLAEATYAIRDGALWVASNLDLTVPTVRGIAPGNGTLVRAVRDAVGRDPDEVAGKPYRALFDETVLRVSSKTPLVVGDRLDTDVRGAVNCGADSLLVMTGVTDVTRLCQASSEERPDFVAWTLDALLAEQTAPVEESGRWRLAGWEAAVDGDGRVEVHRRGDDADDGLRVVASASWGWRDEHPEALLDLDGIGDISQPTTQG